MFTGLIEAVGRVRRVVPAVGSTRLTIETELPVAAMRDGESVAVDGVCLTVTRRSGKAFTADAVAETLSRTTLGGVRAGDTVHLERSLAVGDRLGGHLVQGHVDAVAKVIALRRRGHDVRLDVALPKSLRGGAGRADRAAGCFPDGLRGETAQFRSRLIPRRWSDRWGSVPGTAS
jgi:riboflavin synthase